MNSRARVYLLSIIFLAGLYLPVQDWQALLAMPSDHLAGVAALIAVAVLSEWLSVSATVGRHQASSSIAFIPFFAAAVLFPAPAAVVTATVTVGVTQYFIHRRPKLNAAFNTAQACISMAVANWLFDAVGGVASAPVQLDALKSWSGVLSLLALSFAFFMTNHALISIAIALKSEERISVVFGRVLAPSGGNIVQDVMASPIAVVVALLFSLGIAGLFIGVLPLLIIRHAYQSNFKLQQANKDLLTVLVKTIETRDPYTSGHSIRVALLARAIAEDMDLSAPTVDRIEMAAIVHDIGKVDAIYASLIRKEGPLSEAERTVILTHAAKGAEFLETLTSFPADVIRGVRHHHERYDGTGYPARLVGADIPLPARIIQLCDSIDAMLSDRPYRKALSIDYVREELLRCAGTQFDPRIVDIILRKNTLERAAALVRPETLKPQLIKVTA